MTKVKTEHKGTLTESISMTTSNGCHVIATFADESVAESTLQRVLDTLQHDFTESSIVR